MPRPRRLRPAATSATRGGETGLRYLLRVLPEDERDRRGRVHDEIRGEERAAGSSGEETVRRLECAPGPGLDVAVYRADSRRCEGPAG